jgi:phosphoglycolate phosphatase-like HAD superfamily hydrolase
MKPVIALDADGVLLDYNLAYAGAWERAFGHRPAEIDPHAYWAMARWAVQALEGERLQQFRACMDDTFWRGIPALEGAVQACHALHETGHELVCVTALAACFEQARLANLRALSFPIERVVATGRATGPRSPKADALRQLAPAAFVDDFLPYLRDIGPGIHAALVCRGPNGTPNTGPDLVHAHSQHADLMAFSQWWLGQRTGHT